MAEGFMFVPAESDGLKTGDSVMVQLLQGMEFQAEANLEPQMNADGHR